MMQFNWGCALAPKIWNYSPLNSEFCKQFGISEYPDLYYTQYEYYVVIISLLKKTETGTTCLKDFLMYIDTFPVIVPNKKTAHQQPALCRK